MNRILVLNAGSSSLKYALFDVMKEKIKSSIASGIIEKIGSPSQVIKHSVLANKTQETIKINERNIIDHDNALTYILSLLSENVAYIIDVVGHRVVHGGEHLMTAQVINDHVIERIRQAIPLAPLHNPANLLGIQTAIKVLPKSVQHVAVFDTAFYSAIPKHAYLYGLPYNLYTEYGVRKYGFHGTSHEYVMQKASEFLSKPIKSLNLITCHLGAGASISCIQNGVCVDTSMGMTPLEGLIMATRCGDVDGSVIFYLMKHLNMSPRDVENLLQNQSGWFGLSGFKDARDLEDSCKIGTERSIIAVKAIVHRIRKYLGAYYWNLGGKIDGIVFTAGVGENWSQLRELCMENTDEFGFCLDTDKNACRIMGKTTDVSSYQSRRKILVIPTDEEKHIAQQTLEIFRKMKRN